MDCRVRPERQDRGAVFQSRPMPYRAPLPVRSRRCASHTVGAYCKFALLERSFPIKELAMMGRRKILDRRRRSNTKLGTFAVVACLVSSPDALAQQTKGMSPLGTNAPRVQRAPAP